MADKPQDIEVDVEPIFWNMVLIRDTHAEFILDFGQILPQAVSSVVYARLVSAPVNVKAFAIALAEHVANYENNYGEIKIVDPNLAGDLFSGKKELLDS